jgi:hypothetical protein
MQENTKEIMSVHDLFCVFFMNQFHNISFFSILVQISLFKKAVAVSTTCSSTRSSEPFFQNYDFVGWMDSIDRFSKIMIS